MKCFRCNELYLSTPLNKGFCFKCLLEIKDNKIQTTEIALQMAVEELLKETTGTIENTTEIINYLLKKAKQKLLEKEAADDGNSQTGTV